MDDNMRLRAAAALELRRRAGQGLADLLEWMSEDEKIILAYVSEIIERAQQKYREETDSEEGEPPAKEFLVYVSNDDLTILEQAAEILERAVLADQARRQAIKGNGHSTIQTTIVHRQKIRGRPWKN